MRTHQADNIYFNMDGATWRAVFFGCLALIFLVGCGFYPGTESRLRTADANLISGDYQGAAAELQAVLKRDSVNVAALVSLAKVELKLGDPDAAQSYLNRALAAGAKSAELRELSGEVLLARGRFDDLLKSTAAVAGESSNVQTLTLRAAAQIGLKDYAAAEQSLAEAQRQAPDDPQALLYVAQLRAEEGKSGEALTALDRAVARNPALMQAWLLRGRLLMVSAKYADASAAFKHVTDGAPGQVSVPEEILALSGQAEALLAQNDVKSAAEVVKLLKLHHQNTIPAHYLQGRLALQNGDAQTAVNEFRIVTNAAPDNVAMKSLLGAALLAQGSHEQALATLSEVVAQNPADQNARKLLAQAQLTDNKPDDARRTLLGAADAANTDGQADWLMAISLMETGDVKGGIAFLEKSVAAAPANTPAQLALARAYLSNRQYEQARVLLEKLPPDKRDASSQRLQIMAQIGGKTRPEAARELEELVKANPTDANLLAIAGVYASNFGDTAQASRYFAQALQSNPENVTAHLGSASLAARASDFKTATAHFQAILARDPKHQQAMLGLASIALRQGGTADAREWLEKAIAAQPSAVEARLNLAQLEFRAGNAARATALLDQAIAVAPDRGAVTNAAGDIALRTDRRDEALERFEAAVRLGARGAAINVARAQMALGRVDAARQTLVAIKEQPYADRASLMLVELDAQAGKLAEARQRIASLRQNGLSASAASELEGNVSWVAKQIDAAARSYSQAYDAMPSQALAIKLFRARRAQKAAEPEKILERWLERSPADNAVRTILAVQLQQTGKNPAAIAQYQSLLGAMPKPEPAILNNLAWAYYQVGDRRALETATQAYDTDSSKAYIADTYGWLLVESGDVGKGKPKLEGAVQREPNNPSFVYHLAAARARSGDKGMAIRDLTQLLGAKQDFDERRAAEQLLKSLSDR